MPCYVHKGKQKLVVNRLSKNLAFLFTWDHSVWAAYVSIKMVVESYLPTYFKTLVQNGERLFTLTHVS